MKTIEEKAKAYDEAIRKAKITLDCCNSASITTKNTIYDIFPELNPELEDKRIRKELKHYLDVRKCLTTDDEEYIACNHFIDWLEKQDNKKQDKQKEKFFEFKASDWYVSKVDGKIHNIYQSVDKIEPKFKVGDWYVYKGKTYHLLSDNNGLWTIEDTDGRKYSPCEPTDIDEDDFHLWTIQDARNGDVLATHDFIFIFKSIDNSNGVHYYCHYEIDRHEDDEQFGVALPQSLMGHADVSHYAPATKEQRELLFQKIAEAGCKWDAEKKELADKF